jgi:hypothetical protein
MRDVEHEAEFCIAINESTQQGNRVCASGDGYGEAKTGTEERVVEWKCRSRLSS